MAISLWAWLELMREVRCARVQQELTAVFRQSAQKAATHLLGAAPACGAAFCPGLELLEDMLR